VVASRRIVCTRYINQLHVATLAGAESIEAAPTATERGMFSRLQLSTQIPKLGNRARSAGLLPPKEGMILPQLFCSVGMTAGYQQSSSTSRSTSYQLRYMGSTTPPQHEYFFEQLYRPALNRELANDFFGIFVSSQTQKDRLTELVVAGPLGKLDLSNQHWLDPVAAFHD